MGREDAIATWGADVTSEANITDDVETDGAAGQHGDAIADDPTGNGSERKRIAMANITLRINIRDPI